MIELALLKKKTMKKKTKKKKKAMAMKKKAMAKKTMKKKAMKKAMKTKKKKAMKTIQSVSTPFPPRPRQLPDPPNYYHTPPATNPSGDRERDEAATKAAIDQPAAQ